MTERWTLFEHPCSRQRLMLEDSMSTTVSLRHAKAAYVHLQLRLPSARGVFPWSDRISAVRLPKLLAAAIATRDQRRPLLLATSDDHFLRPTI